MSETDNILTKVHDLLLSVVPMLAKFPCDHKFTLGDRILARPLVEQDEDANQQMHLMAHPRRIRQR